MTNLLEKSLLIAFGLFTLMIFISIIIPYFLEIKNSDLSSENNSNDFNDFINEIDNAINYVIKNPEEISLLEINSNEDLNITCMENQVFFYCKTIEETRIINYDKYFIEKKIVILKAEVYILEVKFHMGIRKINMSIY